MLPDAAQLEVQELVDDCSQPGIQCGQPGKSGQGPGNVVGPNFLVHKGVIVNV